MNKHDHASKGAPRVSPSMELPGRPSVIAHADAKSVHTHRSPGRNDPQNVALAADREVGEGHAGGAPGSTNPTPGGWVPPATGNPAFAPDAGVQAALYYERQNNAAGRPPLK